MTLLTTPIFLAEVCETSLLKVKAVVKVVVLLIRTRSKHAAIAVRGRCEVIRSWWIRGEAGNLRSANPCDAPSLYL